MAKLMLNRAANAAANGEIGIFAADFTTTTPPPEAKKTACPKARGLVNLASAGPLNFGFAVLEHLDRFAQLLIRLRRLGLVLLGRRVRVLVLVWSYGVVVAVSDQNVRRNRRVLNSLPTRRVVFRNRENQG